MKIVSAAAALILAAAGFAGSAAAQHGPGGSIPAQFHGRWAENRRACRPTHFTTVITITRTGWSSFEEGGDVQRPGRMRAGTFHVDLLNYAGGNETGGSLALRRAGPRLIATFQDDGAQAARRVLIRCR
jgi:hypothetical protein